MPGLPTFQRQAHIIESMELQRSAGVERELPLVMAASALSQANKLEAACCVHGTSNSLRSLQPGKTPAAGASCVDAEGCSCSRAWPIIIVHEVTPCPTLCAAAVAAHHANTLLLDALG